MDDTMRKIIATVVFIAIELLLLPISLIGYVWLAVKLILISRRTGMSATAYSPLFTRWMLHETGVRKDLACKRVLMSLPGISALNLHMLTGSTFLAARLSGLQPGFMNYPVTLPSTIMTMVNHRTAFFDKALLDHLDKVKQVVILGAGWDTRAYNMLKEDRVRVFEVDTAKTQRVKQTALQQAGIDTAHVTFVTADFNREPWLDSLKRYNFDPKQPAFFLWEGVIYYLEAEAVKATINAVSSQITSGSAIAFDYFCRELVAGVGRLTFRYGAKWSQAVGEPLQFGIPTESTGP
ncbi:MAG: SAM-dependent methyltransferase [Chloroflexales bacterium]|nr:SAM-dependent methyltransferase [Chloroflexales bacterium]